MFTRHVKVQNKGNISDGYFTKKECQLGRIFSFIIYQVLLRFATENEPP